MQREKFQNNPQKYWALHGDVPPHARDWLPRASSQTLPCASAAYCLYLMTSEAARSRQEECERLIRDPPSSWRRHVRIGQSRSHPFACEADLTTRHMAEGPVMDGKRALEFKNSVHGRYLEKRTIEDGKSVGENIAVSTHSSNANPKPRKLRILLN